MHFKIGDITLSEESSKKLEILLHIFFRSDLTHITYSTEKFQNYINEYFKLVCKFPNTNDFTPSPTINPNQEHCFAIYKYGSYLLPIINLKIQDGNIIDFELVDSIPSVISAIETSKLLMPMFESKISDLVYQQLSRNEYNFLSHLVYKLMHYRTWDSDKLIKEGYLASNNNNSSLIQREHKYYIETSDFIIDLISTSKNRL